MRKKIALNVFYNIAIFICALLVYNGFADKHYEYVAGGLVIGAILIVFKIRLIKEVRDTQN